MSETPKASATPLAPNQDFHIASDAEIALGKDLLRFNVNPKNPVTTMGGLAVGGNLRGVVEAAQVTADQTLWVRGTFTVEIVGRAIECKVARMIKGMPCWLPWDEASAAMESTLSIRNGRVMQRVAAVEGA